uniref:Uncharacterized protein n=1 Tax=Knipowitschia caucasica TaxID=637954 RepID=A0AAV2J0K5_KNICA
MQRLACTVNGNDASKGTKEGRIETDCVERYSGGRGHGGTCGGCAEPRRLGLLLMWEKMCADRKPRCQLSPPLGRYGGRMGRDGGTSRDNDSISTSGFVSL